jgi:hypothetical protein
MAKLTTSVDQISILSKGTAPLMLATLDRNWSNDARQLPHTLNVLYAQSLASQATLSRVMTATPITTTIANKPETATRTARVRAMLDAENQEVAFSSVSATPQALTSSRRLALLSLLSNEWSPNSTAWDTASTQFLTDTNNVVQSVQLVDSSTVLFLTDQGALPITVGNKLDQTVTVYITVRPETTQLSVDKKYSRVALTLDPESQRKAQVPVQSLSNGKVAVTVTLYALDGTAIGTTKSININVQAGWETVGTLIFGALVVALFGFGIFRNVRKRRKARGE